MVQNGKSFAVVRGYCSYGGVDPNAANSVKNFWDGGMSHVDVYLFPCPAKPAAEQVNALVSAMKSAKAKFGQIWLDIETNPSPGCSWGVVSGNATVSGNASATANNCAYIAQLADAVRANGIAPGVYASSSMWNSIAGADCKSVSADSLWYAHYDGNPSFSDWSSFGGWSKPAMKQYSGSGSLCGVGVDSNWYP